MKKFFDPVVIVVAATIVAVGAAGAAVVHQTAKPDTMSVAFVTIDKHTTHRFNNYQRAYVDDATGTIYVKDDIGVEHVFRGWHIELHEMRMPRLVEDDFEVPSED